MECIGKEVWNILGNCVWIILMYILKWVLLISPAGNVLPSLHAPYSVCMHCVVAENVQTSLHAPYSIYMHAPCGCRKRSDELACTDGCSVLMFIYITFSLVLHVDWSIKLKRIGASILFGDAGCGEDSILSCTCIGFEELLAYLSTVHEQCTNSARTAKLNIIDITLQDYNNVKKISRNDYIEMLDETQTSTGKILIQQSILIYSQCSSSCLKFYTSSWKTSFNCWSFGQMCLLRDSQTHAQEIL